MRKVVVGTLGAAAVVGGLYIGVKTLSDEPPIRVRNGSIEVFAGVEDGKAWRWAAEDHDADENEPSFSHEPDHLHPELGKDLWVKVVPVGSPGPDTYQCNATTGSARQVFVDVTSPTTSTTINARMRRSRSGILNQRSKIRPKGAFTADQAGTLLRTSDDGFVTRVRVGQLECTFKTKESLDTIYVCMSSSDGSCK